METNNQQSKSDDQLMTINDETCTVSTGDTILIPPGAAHKIRNSGGTTVKILLLLFTPLPP